EPGGGRVVEATGAGGDRVARDLVRRRQRAGGHRPRRRQHRARAGAARGGARRRAAADGLPGRPRRGKAAVRRRVRARGVLRRRDEQDRRRRHARAEARVSVRADMTMSLDGFVAGPNASLEKPLGEGGERLHEWMVNLASFRAEHGLEDGETGPEDDRLRAFTESNAAFVMGRNMFSGGFGAGPWADDPNPNGWWGDEPP